MWWLCGGVTKQLSGQPKGPRQQPTEQHSQSHLKPRAPGRTAHHTGAASQGAPGCAGPAPAWQYGCCQGPARAEQRSCAAPGARSSAASMDGARAIGFALGQGAHSRVRRLLKEARPHPKRSAWRRVVPRPPPGNPTQTPARPPATHTWLLSAASTSRSVSLPNSRGSDASLLLLSRNVWKRGTQAGKRREYQRAVQAPRQHEDARLSAWRAPDPSRTALLRPHPHP